jgi:nitrogen-specific signal transduction histidine kinase
MFKLFPELIAFYIDSNDRQTSSEATLADERKTAELREQFVGVLGHDLRNPLASIEGEAQLLMRRRSTTGRRVIVEMMRNGVARMSELINNVLDLTQARLGGGFQLNRVNEGGLGPVLEQVIAEQRFARPDRAIEMECKLDELINCDRARVAQLFSNLIRLTLVSGGASNIATRKLGLDRANRVARIDSDPDNTTAFLAASGDAIEKRTREFVPDSDLLQVEQVCLVIDRTSGTSAE